MPYVSIIMPAYNRAWIIKRAIESILVQTYGNFELIVVDDGSTDNTAEVISGFTDRRVTLLKGEHKGASAARNLGISKARGELLAYLDTDNLWHSNFLDVMVSEFKPDEVMLYSAQNLFLTERLKDDTLKILGRQTRTTTFNPAKLLVRNFIDINSVVLRRSLLDRVGTFNESLPGVEDWELFARIVLLYPLRGIRYVDQVLSDYYFFTSDSTETVSNLNFSEEGVQRSFGIEAVDPLTEHVRQLIAEYEKKSQSSK